MPADPNSMSFEDLSSIYRQEKGSTTLVKIRKDFYSEAPKLIRSIMEECDRIDPDSPLYDGVVKKKRNAQTNLKAIVNSRMEKIALMAVRSAIGANNIIDDLTEEEKEYYREILEASRKEWTLADVKKKKAVIPDITEPAAKPEHVRKAMPEEPKTVPKKAPEPVTEDIPLSEMPVDDAPMPEEETAEEQDEEEIPIPVPEEIPFEIPEEELGEAPEETPEEIPAEIPEEVPEEPPKEEPKKEPVAVDPDAKFITIRILESIPTFSGPERNYTLVKEDIVRMPAMIANVLINRGIAEPVSTS